MRFQTTLVVVIGLVWAAPASAQEASARAQTGAGSGGTVCVTIDEARDTLPAPDRTAAVFLVRRQFERAGETVVPGPTNCSTAYTLSHIRLGRTISVTLAGPAGFREGTALGLDDLLALYSQMVRSMVTGRPMSGFNVVDRTNVTDAQASSGRRVQTDSFRYTRLGGQTTFGDRAYSGPVMGFGFRVELDSFGVDVSFFNAQVPTGSGNGYTSAPHSTAAAVSVLKLQGLYFLRPHANASLYAGGGVSWGMTSFSNSENYSGTYSSGSGLQGALTVGYELPRASTLRVFVQADVVLPMYRTTTESYSYSYPTSGSRTPPPSPNPTTSRYTPSVGVSVGLGWHRNRGR